MSAEKLLASIGGPNKNTKNIHPGKIQLSDLYVDPMNYVKAKEIYHQASEYKKTLQAFGFGRQAQVQLTPAEMFLGRLYIKCEFSFGGNCTLPPVFGHQVIDQVQVNLPGSQRVFKSGDLIFVQNMYEANSDNKRNALIELAGGNANVVNPTGSFVTYILLPVLTSSVDERRNYKYPIHLLNSNIDIQIRFRNAVDCVVATPTNVNFVNAELLYERYNLYDPKMLKSKKDVYVLPYYEAREFFFSFTGDNVNAQTIRVDGVTEDSETVDMLIQAELDSERGTNKNYVTGLDIRNLIAKLADREIIRSEDAKFHRIMQLVCNKDELAYTLSGTKQRYFRIPFSPLPYKEQASHNKYVNGSDLSQDDIKISFISAVGASRLKVYTFKKKLITFHNGLQQNIR